MEVTSDLKKDVQNVLTAGVASADEAAELLEAAKVEEGDFENIAVLIGRTNRPEFNTLKLCEELSELSEKLLKSVCKSPAYKPTDESIIEEMGDCILRMMIWTVGKTTTPEAAEALERAIEKRMIYKAKKLVEYYESGKYVGGV